MKALSWMQIALSKFHTRLWVVLCLRKHLALASPSLGLFQDYCPFLSDTRWWISPFQELYRTFYQFKKTQLPCQCNRRWGKRRREWHRVQRRLFSFSVWKTKWKNRKFHYTVCKNKLIRTRYPFPQTRNKPEGLYLPSEQLWIPSPEDDSCQVWLKYVPAYKRRRWKFEMFTDERYGNGRRYDEMSRGRPDAF